MITDLNLILALSIGLGLFVAVKRLAPRPGRTLTLLAGVTLGAHAAVVLLPVHSLWLSNSTLLGSALFGGCALGRHLGSPRALFSFAALAALLEIVFFGGRATEWMILCLRPEDLFPLAGLLVTFPLGDGLNTVLGWGDAFVLTTLYTSLDRQSGDEDVSFYVPLLGLVVALSIRFAGYGFFPVPLMAGALGLYALHRRRSGRRRQRRRSKRPDVPYELSTLDS